MLPTYYIALKHGRSFKRFTTLRKGTTIRRSGMSGMIAQMHANAFFRVPPFRHRAV